MRHPDRAIRDQERIDAIISGSQVMRLALSLNDQPYMVPVCFGYDGTALWFHTGTKGRKIEYLEQNPKVCFLFEHNVALLPHPDLPCGWSMAYETVIGTGSVLEAIDPADKAAGLRQIMLQYSASTQWSFDPHAFAGTRVWRITIEHMQGRRSKHGFG